MDSKSGIGRGEEGGGAIVRKETHSELCRRRRGQVIVAIVVGEALPVMFGLCGCGYVMVTAFGCAGDVDSHFLLRFVLSELNQKQLQEKGNGKKHKEGMRQEPCEQIVSIYPITPHTRAQRTPLQLRSP